MIQCVQSASKPSTSKVSLQFQSSALRSLFNLYIQMCTVPSLHRSSETLNTIYYTSMITQGIHPYGCSQIRMPWPLPLPTSHFRPKQNGCDTSSSDSGAIIDGQNTTRRPSGMSSRHTVPHTSHAIHTATIRMVLPNERSVQSLKWPGQLWLTLRPPFCSGEKQLIPQSISIEHHNLQVSEKKLPWWP